jgi:hypothetical protein
MDTHNLSTLEAEASNENTAPQRLEELARSSPELAQRVVQNPSAPPELLRELSRLKNRIVRQNITTNPNTPTDILRELAGHYPEAFLENPIVSLLFIEQPDFLQTLSSHTVFRLFRCEAVPIFWLTQVSVQARITLARDKLTPTAILERLAGDRDVSVRRELAGNPRIPDVALEQLSNDEDNRVRKGVAQNPQTRFLLLQKLACDPRYPVREAVARHPYTPIVLLQKLAEDSRKSVSSTAIDHLKRRGYDICKV